MVTSCLQKIESRYPKFGLQDIDCDLGCLIYAYIYATAASLWRIVEIQLLASVGWKRVCESSGCRCSQHVTTCLSKESILAINSKHPLPLRATARSTNSTFLHHSQIRCSWRKPVSCREAEGLVTELWSPKSVTMYWLSSSVTTADKVFSLRGLETRLWVSATDVRTMWRHVCFRIHSSHSVLEFQASTPYQKLEAPESRSMLHQFCIMLVSCPSLRCSCRKKRVSCKEAKGLVTELWSPRFVTHNTVIVSKVWVTGYWLCSQLWHVTAANQWNPMNNCRDWQDWDFSIRGLEVGLRAFQLRMFSKCDALPKRDLFDMFV